MARFGPVLTNTLLAMRWFPVNGIADEAAKSGKPSSDTQATQSQTGTTSDSGALSSDKTTKKPDQKDVRSRGLFAKKKKKQVGGSAGHSQDLEQGDHSSRNELGVGK